MVEFKQNSANMKRAEVWVSDHLITAKVNM